MATRSGALTRNAIRKQEEEDFFEALRSLMSNMPVKWYRTYRSTRSPAGWLDLSIVGIGSAIWRELKTDTGPISPEQIEWMDWMRRAGLDVDVWRPADLKPAGGRIVKELRALRFPQAVIL